MYCETVFYLLFINVLISLNPDSFMAPFQGGVKPISVQPLPRLSACDPSCGPMHELVQYPIYSWRQHPRLRPKQQHLLDYRLENNPDNILSAPSLLSIRFICPQLFCAFLTFPATAGQFLSPAVSILPRYLKLVTVFSCFP